MNNELRLGKANLFLLFKKTYLLILGFSLLMICFYCLSNLFWIGQHEQHYFNVFVVAFGFVGVFSHLLYLLKWQRIKVSKSHIFLLMFYLYVVYRYYTDISDINVIKTSLKSLVIYWLLGLFINNTFCSIISIVNNDRRLELFCSHFVTFWLLVYFFLLILICISLLTRIRSDIFLIKDLDGDYQNHGNYLLLSHIIMSFVYCVFCLITKNHFTRFLYLIISIVTLAISQSFGSNNAFVNVGIVTFVSFANIVLQNSKNFCISPKSYLLNLYYLMITIFKILKPLLWVTLILYWVFLGNLPKIRILNYGEGSVSSVETRKKILINNFLIHHSHSPVFGNMNIENLTTGKGSYIHSFCISIITHTGYFGILIFLFYFVLSLLESFFNREYVINRYLDGYVRCKILVLVCVFLIANLSAFFVRWTPMWFLFGFTFPLYIIKPNTMRLSKNEQ